jgi:Tol biopolymer transport system component
MAVPFNLQRLEAAANAPVALDDIVDGDYFAISRDGTLAYKPGGKTLDAQLAWVDRRGEMQRLPAPPRNYWSPSLSPDGGRAALESVGGVLDIVIYDLERGTLSRLTSEGSSQVPIWTPDGSRIVYRATRAGTRNLFWKPVDGGGPEERLTTGEYVHTPHSWSPDGKLLAYEEEHPETGDDIWLLPIEGDRSPRPFLKTRFHEWFPRFSPDGRWLAYVSNESGRDEVYVQPFPGPGRRWQISTEGGTAPVWARSGRELFYRNGRQLMSVEVATQPGFSATHPRSLFEGQYRIFRTDYDVSPDGQRFLMLEPLEPPQPATQINVVLNWFEELKQKVPTGK